MQKHLASRFGAIFKLSIAAILLAVPLYPKFPLFRVPGTYVAVRVEDFLLLIVVLIWGFYLLKTGQLGRFLNDRFTQAVFLFLVAGLLSVLSALLITGNISPHLAFLHWIRRLEYILLFFIAYSAVTLSGRISFFTYTLFIASFFVFLYGVGQVYFNLPVITTQNEEYSKGIALRWVPGARLPSTFAGHYDLAAFSMFVLTFGFAWMFLYTNFLYKIFLLAFVVAPAFWLLLMTESRISFLAYLFSVSSMFVFLQKKKFILPIVLVSIVVAVFTGLGARYWRTIDVYLQKLRTYNMLIVSPVYAQEATQSAPVEDRSVSIRLNIEWPRAVNAFLKNPLLGTGYSSINLATDNDYLRLLGEVGLVGFMAFFLLLLRLIEGFGSFLQKNNLSDAKVFVAAFVGCLIGLLVNALLIDVFEASKIAIVFWTLAGLAAGIVRGRKNGEVY